MKQRVKPDPAWNKWVWVKIRYPNNGMVNTQLNIHICGPLGLPFWPTSKWRYRWIFRTKTQSRNGFCTKSPHVLLGVGTTLGDMQFDQLFTNHLAYLPSLVSQYLPVFTNNHQIFTKHNMFIPFYTMFLATIDFPQFFPAFPYSGINPTSGYNPQLTHTQLGYIHYILYIQLPCIMVINHLYSLVLTG